MRFLTLFFFLMLSATVFSQDKDGTLIKAGEKVPDFQFETSQGKFAKLSDYKGKVIIVNFFATWCGPCRVELPQLHERIYNKYKDNSNFALFVFGREEDWNVVLPFKTENNFTFPMLPDAKKQIYSKFATQYIPRTLLIDKEGTIVHSSIGYNEEDFKTMEKKLNKLMKN